MSSYNQNIVRWLYDYYIHAVPDPQSVSLTSDPVSPIINDRDVTLVCTVKMSQEVLDSEIFLLMVDVQVSQPDGTPLILTGPTVTGTTFTYTTQFNSFGRSDSGSYTCNATVRPQPSSTYLTGISTMLDIARLTTSSLTIIIITSPVAVYFFVVMR